MIRAIMVPPLIVLFVLVGLIAACDDDGDSAEKVSCVDTKTGAQMTLEEAVRIALDGECGQQGALQATHMCNPDTGTWWIDLDADKPGCNPACVVAINDKTAEINWRCTGAIQEPDQSAIPQYADAGPYPVGVTTLDLGDRLVEVWYPGQPGSEEGVSLASYASFDMLPEQIQSLVPTELNTTYEMPAHRDIPVSTDAPFPILTFSHGASGYRLVNSNLLAGIASHGLIVASIDHIEWGMLAMTGLGSAPDRDVGEILLATIDLIESENTTSGGFFEGWADVSMVASAGHSMGGLAAFALPEGAGIDAVIGYATVVGQDPSLIDQPALLLVGAEDSLADPNEAAYETLTSPKRFISVAKAGHNSFTDSCDSLFRGNDFIQDMIDTGFPLPDFAVELAYDGCRPENLPPREFWKIVQHFTVAHLRAAFGIDDPPVGLGPGIANAFEGVDMVCHSQD